ncbi:MAG: PaaX family transcriptional regulator C-terminal domain-containing protein [Polyangiales bacterium]
MSAKSILAEVLSVAHAGAKPSVRVSLLIDAGALFGFSANTVRVTLAKMRAAGDVDSPSRGLYRLGPRSRDLSDRVMGWRTVSARMTSWDGSWIGVFTGHLSRTDRPALGRRNRALRLVGFRSLEEGLYVRPNNLAGRLGEVRTTLERLGLEAGAVVMRLDELADDDTARAVRLWDCDAIVAGYRDLRRQLRDSMLRRDELPLEESMREAFMLGREVIRWVALDPLLPAQMVPVDERDALVEEMIRYDKTGQVLWWRYLGVNESEVAA